MIDVVDAALLFVIHLVAVWVAWFVMIAAIISLNCYRELYVDRLEFPPFYEIADAAFWWATAIFIGYALTKTPISLVCWMLNL